MNDKQLRKLLEDVQQKSFGSQEWRLSMDRLLIRIKKFEGLFTCSHPDYLDALNRTWEWVCHNIKGFKPLLTSVQRSLVKWVNSHLYWRIKDLYRTDRRKFPSLEQLMSENEEESSLLDQVLESRWNPVDSCWLENYIKQSEIEELRRIGLALEQAVEADIGDRLKLNFLQGQKQCNCKLLSQHLLFKEPTQTLASLSRELNCNSKTVLSHWKKKCKPCLQKMAIELNYQPH